MDIPGETLIGKACVALVLFYVARAVMDGVSAIYAFTLRPGKNLKRLGKWAIVTGATDGIGEVGGPDSILCGAPSASRAIA